MIISTSIEEEIARRPAKGLLIKHSDYPKFFGYVFDPSWAILVYQINAITDLIRENFKQISDLEIAEIYFSTKAINPRNNTYGLCAIDVAGSRSELIHFKLRWL